MNSLPECYDSYIMSSKEKQRFCTICGIGLFSAAWLFYQSVALALVFALLSGPGSRIYSRYLAEQRKDKLRDQFRDLLYSLSASIAAGRQLGEALAEGRENMKLICGEDGLITRELTQMVKRIQESREPEEEILQEFARRSGIDDIRCFADVYFTCRKTGGDLERVTVKAAEVLLEKMGIDREIRLLTAQKRLEARILSAVPFLVIGFLRLTSPDYLAVMYETAIGRILMTLALVGVGFSYLWSMKLTQIQV